MARPRARVSEATCLTQPRVVPTPEEQNGSHGEVARGIANRLAVVGDRNAVLPEQQLVREDDK